VLFVVDTFIHGHVSREYGNNGKEGKCCDRRISDMFFFARKCR
jgi:hypothetical protein